MVAAIGAGTSSTPSAGGATGAGGGSDRSSLAALQKQLETAQKQLAESIACTQTDAARKEQQNLARQIVSVQAQIAQLRAAAQQAAEQQNQPSDSSQTAQPTQAASASTRSRHATLGTVIDTYA
jgi:hypothetical protein